jgi:hypothetical protein
MILMINSSSEYCKQCRKIINCLEIVKLNAAEIKETFNLLYDDLMKNLSVIEIRLTVILIKITYQSELYQQYSIPVTMKIQS